jgi:hypothetical protein
VKRLRSEFRKTKAPWHFGENYWSNSYTKTYVFSWKKKKKRESHRWNNNTCPNVFIPIKILAFKLENIILSEVSLAQKTKNCMFSLMWKNTTRGLDFDHMIKWEHARKVWG